MVKGLTLKERAFINETIKTLNPTEAVRRVYNLGSKGGSKTKEAADNTAYVIASQKLRKLKTHPDFQELLSQIDDAAILEKLNAIAMDQEDKRACLQAIDMILKLKNKYPEQTTKIMGLFAGLK